MNQRFLLALLLTAIVIVVTPLVFNRQSPPVTPGLKDSTTRKTGVATPTTSTPTVAATTPAQNGTAVPPGTVPSVSPTAGETTLMRSPRAQYQFTNVGAVPAAVVLDSYPSRRPGMTHKATELVVAGDRLVHLAIVSGREIVPLDGIALSKVASAAPNTIEFEGTAGTHPVRVSYRVPATAQEDYLLHARVDIPNAPAGTAVQIRLADRLFSNEPDTADDIGHLGISYHPARGGVESVGYSKLDSAEVVRENGPINWLALRNKYFLLAVRGVSAPFSSLAIEGKPRVNKLATHMGTTGTILLQNGSATFDIYAGPQDFERLQRLGGDMDQVNPYAGWFHGVVQPVAAVVMKVLLWMKRTTQLNYGWVLVLFGVAIRLLLWPLNQGAMRTSMKMQRLQPELQALQKKYADDPRKQQEAIMKVYKDHDMSPLSPLMGCLPMLLPMPVLFALYFVFNNTIEFRGVPFLWLPDISLRDPYYITPLLMGVSMFLMSWIGMRNSPPNPQAKMMSYMMPVMLTVLFLNFASGLNLYYAVQNVAAIPQQWLLARERGKSPTPVVTPAAMPGRKRNT